MKDFKPSKIFSLDNAWPFDGDDDEPEEGVPVRLVGAWTDTVMSKPGQKSQRGFGGRITFYGENEEKPILVDGQLVVYAFDEAGRQPTDNKPTRRYVFPSDQMKLHMSKSDMGASYSFWLPWDEVGGPKAEVSLICRFEPKGGAVISGEQTRHLLPGTMLAESANNRGSGPQLPEGEPVRPKQVTLESLRIQQQQQQQVHGGAQLASYESATNFQPTVVANSVNAAATTSGEQMTVTSITLPDNFQMPDAASLRAASLSNGQVNQTQQAVMPTPPAQFPQPATGVQPGYQMARPNLTNGAGVMPQLPAVQNQMVPAPIQYAPPLSNSFAAPISTPQYVGQQRTAMQSGQPMIAPPAQMGAAPQQQPQMIPQQGWQQLPVANGVRTAVSHPPPATIPWR